VTQETASKPRYLGTLNAIALAESAAGRYLSAWADVTPNEGLREILRCVAARETSHGDVFARRIRELGFELRPREDPEAQARYRKYASPDISDLEKVGPEPSDGEPDPFAAIEQQLSEGLYDPLTALLMRWYIAEERDSGRLLRSCYAQVRAEAKPASSNGAGASSDREAIIQCMVAGFERLEKSLKKLRKGRA
jgi:rubrerythrin